MRSKNGGEYIDGGLGEYCGAEGIILGKTIQGTPQLHIRTMSIRA